MPTAANLEKSTELGSDGQHGSFFDNESSLVATLQSDTKKILLTQNTMGSPYWVG